MKPGDLVRINAPANYQALLPESASIGLVVRSEWYVDQVSEPHGLADVLIDGQIWYAIPFDLLVTFEPSEQMENT